MKVAIFFFFLLILTSCSQRSLEDYQEEGEGVIHSLIQEMSSIHTRNELMLKLPQLQMKFNRLVDIMIKASQFREKHPSLEVPEPKHDLSDRLRIEMNRLCNIPGGSELLQKSQELALHRLDAFENKLKRTKTT